MTLAVAVAALPKGHAKPRIAPPVPARSDLTGFRASAKAMDITLMPWQETAGRYLTAKGRDGRLLYREVGIVVARQNGKTTLMKPLIVRALRAGKRVMHIAQNRELPRHMFGVIADALSDEKELFPTRRGRTIWPRYGSGQEEITLANGGTYRIAAASRGGGRGWTNDLVVVDELREMETFDVIMAAEPTLTMSPDPQMVYLSNAGTERSVVLNSVRDRAGQDSSLAYLEWSAAPDRAADDSAGWAEANPALGLYPSVQKTLETAYRKHMLNRTTVIFETEHLCRWTNSVREPLVDGSKWASCEVDELPAAVQPVMAVSMDPSGQQASAALAWQQPDETIALRLLFNVTGNPIDSTQLGRDMRDKARELGVTTVAFDPLTDAQLARWFKHSEPITGQKYANASSGFVAAVEAGKLRWHDCKAVTEDLTWTARKEHDESGSFQAVRGDDDRPITAALAAIRAVWLASEPKGTRGKPKPRIGAGF